MAQVASTHRVHRIQAVNPTNPAPVTFESHETRDLIDGGGENRTIETTAFYLTSGKMAQPTDVLVKCANCGGLTDQQHTFECSSCHKVLCRHHLSKVEVIGVRRVQRQDAEGRNSRFEQEVQDLYCDNCWKKEAVKRILIWVGCLFILPFRFLGSVLRDGSQCDQPEEAATGDRRERLNADKQRD